MTAGLKDSELLNIVAQVRTVLESNYSGIGLGAFTEQSKIIEKDIESLIVKLVCDYFSQFDQYKSLSFGRFLLKDELYEVTTGAGLNANEPVLQVWILSSVGENKDFASGGRDIFGVGYYRLFELSVPRSLSYHLEEIENLIHIAYMASYRWLEECFFSNLAELEKGFTGKLYQCLRIYLTAQGKENLAENIWFSIFSPKNGYYSLDSKAVTKILNKLKERKYYSEFSPIYHVSKLIGLEMPYEKSFSKFTIETNEYKEFSLIRAAYVSDMESIYKTEEQMVDNGGYAIFTITEVGDRILVASFPASLKNEILPTLEVIKEDLGAVYKREVRAMAKHIAKINSSYKRIDSSEIAGFVGGLIAGIYKNL